MAHESPRTIIAGEHERERLIGAPRRPVRIDVVLFVLHDPCHGATAVSGGGSRRVPTRVEDAPSKLTLRRARGVDVRLFEPLPKIDVRRRAALDGRRR